MITIVSGLPRSGTSLMMQMLEAGGLPVLTDGVRKPDADNPRGYYELAKAKRLRTDSSWLQEAEGKVLKLIYLLLYELPPGRQYRVVFMEREIDEIIASQNAMLARLGKQGGSLSDADLKKTFLDHLMKVKAWLAGRPGFSVLYVSYNQVVSARESVIDSLRAFLGGDLDAARMAAAIAPGLYRQRRSASP